MHINLKEIISLFFKSHMYESAVYCITSQNLGIDWALPASFPCLSIDLGWYLSFITASNKPSLWLYKDRMPLRGLWHDRVFRPNYTELKVLTVLDRCHFVTSENLNCNVVPEFLGHLSARCGNHSSSLCSQCS